MLIYVISPYWLSRYINNISLQILLNFDMSVFLFISNYLHLTIYLLPTVWLFACLILASFFSFLIVQIAFTMVVFPCLLLAYTGQASYIISHKNHVEDAFYRSIPGFSFIFFLSLFFLFNQIVILMLINSHYKLNSEWKEKKCHSKFPVCSEDAEKPVLFHYYFPLF
jgi:K+ potassium transporter